MSIRSLPWRWRIALMLCLITTINYIDRQALTVTSPYLIDKFGLTDSQYGLITSGFLLAYGLGQLLCGPWIDRFGTKRSFSIAVAAWSIACMLHAFGRGFLSFFSFRVLLGLTEAANFPAALKGIAEWFPRNERSLAVGVLTVGPGLGALLAPPIIVFLLEQINWQAAFLIPGAVGFIWLWAWQRWYFKPGEHPYLDDSEKQLIAAENSAQDTASAKTGWLWALRYKEVWGLLFSRFVSDGAFYFFVFWMPRYLTSERGLDLKTAAYATIVPNIAVDVGALVGGYLGKRWLEQGMQLDPARKRIIWIGALLVPVAMLAGRSESVVTAVALIAVAMFAIQFKASSMFTLPADLFPARDVATIWGLFGAVGSFGGMAFSALAGWTIENYSWQPVFLAVALMHIISALLINLFIPQIKLLPTKEEREAA